MGIEAIRLPEQERTEKPSCPPDQQKEAAGKMHEEVMGKPPVPASNSGSDRTSYKQNSDAAEAKKNGEGDSGKNDDRKKRDGAESNSQRQPINGAGEKAVKELEFSNPYEKR